MLAIQCCLLKSKVLRQFDSLKPAIAAFCRSNRLGTRLAESVAFSGGLANLGHLAHAAGGPAKEATNSTNQVQWPVCCVEQARNQIDPLFNL